MPCTERVQLNVARPVASVATVDVSSGWLGMAAVNVTSTPVAGSPSRSSAAVTVKVSPTVPLVPSGVAVSTMTGWRGSHRRVVLAWTGDDTPVSVAVTVSVPGDDRLQENSARPSTVAGCDPSGRSVPPFELWTSISSGMPVTRDPSWVRVARTDAVSPTVEVTSAGFRVSVGSHQSWLTGADTTRSHPYGVDAVIWSVCAVVGRST